MIVIRRAQEEAFRLAALRRLPPLLVPAVEIAYPMRWRALGADARGLVERIVRRGTALGLGQRPSFERLLSLAFGLDAELGERSGHEWIAALLKNRDLPESVRFDLLEEELAARGFVPCDSLVERRV